MEAESDTLEPTDLGSGELRRKKTRGVEWHVPAWTESKSEDEEEERAAWPSSELRRKSRPAHGAVEGRAGATNGELNQ